MISLALTVTNAWASSLLSLVGTSNEMELGRVWAVEICRVFRGVLCSPCFQKSREFTEVTGCKKKIQKAASVCVVWKS